MPVSKSTKKFEKNKLGDVLKARKNVAKIKQRKQMDAKKKQRKAADNAKADDLEEEAAKKPKKSAKEDNFGDMSMDQFFEGGFDIPKMKKTKPKTGKRKRTPVKEDASEPSSDEDMADATADGDEDGVSASESESGDDFETHKRDIEDLKKKDPEFYKYLENNDKELLDFEDDDLAEMDALSASEDEATPRKKQKKAAKAEPESDEESEAATGNEVSKQLIQKWKSAMETKSSLRAMKEVVLAFRSAAHLNDEEGKAYKYSISDPDGMSPFFPLHAAPLTEYSLPPGPRICPHTRAQGSEPPPASQGERWRQDPRSDRLEEVPHNDSAAEVAHRLDSASPGESVRRLHSAYDTRLAVEPPAIHPLVQEGRSRDSQDCSGCMV
jgi:hypothetical protein